MLTSGISTVLHGFSAPSRYKVIGTYKSILSITVVFEEMLEAQDASDINVECKGLQFGTGDWSKAFDRLGNLSMPQKKPKRS